MLGGAHGPDAFAAAERAARESYGRLLAWLAYQWRDVASAEDALATALAKALETWPSQGVPDAPDAWLLSVARRELLQRARHQRLHESPEVQALFAADASFDSGPAVPDARLKLLFVCAHPAIDAAIRPALMLQTVLGLDASVVAQAMLTSPSAMAQRLVRAKQKIREAGLRFEEPDTDELPERLHAVLEAIYAAYGLGWDALGGGVGGFDETVADLRKEALFLGELVCHLLPHSPEAIGLLALMQLCEARTAARYDLGADGTLVVPVFVPLNQQDTALWNRTGIESANARLLGASQMGEVGQFQIEAAIQSAHCQRLFTGQTPWLGIAHLYDGLVQLAPSLGAQVAQAVAWAQAGEVERASSILAALQTDAMKAGKLKIYPAFWVAKAYVAHRLGDVAVCSKCLDTAIGLTMSPSARKYLIAKKAKTV